MAKVRFKGDLGRRARNSPLLVEHLRIALQETSSKTEERRVYAKLYAMTKELTGEDFLDFYTGLPRRRTELYNPPKCPNEREMSKRGKDLADSLRGSAIVPKKDHPRFSQKYLDTRHTEFNTILKFHRKERENGSPISS